MNSPIPHLKIGGKWLVLPLGNLYTHIPELLQKIALEAKWGEAQEWQPNASRDNADWPLTFEYREVPPWKFWGSALVGAVCLLSVMIYIGKPEPACILIPYGLLMLKSSSTRVPSASLIGQQIIATQEGLTSELEGAEIFLGWSEIETYYLVNPPGSLQPALYVVEGQGKRIEFNSLISDAKVLRNLIAVRAQNVAAPGWRFLHGADDDVLGGADSLWENGNLGVGPEIHHYRTRSARIFLVFGCFVVSLMLIAGAFALNFGREISLADWAMPLAIVLFFGGLTLNGWLTYRFTSLRCQENGLVQRSVWGEKTIPWHEIESIVSNSYGYVVKGQMNTIRFSGLVADLIGLTDRIQKLSGQQIKRT